MRDATDDLPDGWLREVFESASAALGGVKLIAHERQRQIAKGYSEAHDDAHVNGEIAQGAAMYAVPYPLRIRFAQLWPWDMEEFHPCPQDRIKELVKAGAMISAEIDRLLREDRP